MDDAWEPYSDDNDDDDDDDSDDADDNGGGGGGGGGSSCDDGGEVGGTIHGSSSDGTADQQVPRATGNLAPTVSRGNTRQATSIEVSYDSSLTLWLRRIVAIQVQL
jgi:hypothetical protein